MESFAAEYPISVIASTQRTVLSPKIHNFTSVIYDAKAKKFYEEKPYENIEVVDRIGSGDAYCSGVLYEKTEGVQVLFAMEMPAVQPRILSQVICRHWIVRR